MTTLSQVAESTRAAARPAVRAQTQEELVDFYNRKVTELGALQDNWEYTTSKQLADFALLDGAAIDGAEVLNVGCSFPIDEIRHAHRVKRWTATDLGSETIRVAEFAARRQLSPELLERVEFMVADGTALPFADASFDVTLSFSTVDHVVDAEARQRFVDEMARVTRPGGRVVLTTPNRWSRGYAKREEIYGLAAEFFEYCFTPVELRRMVARAGLRVVRFTSTSELPLLAPRALFPRRPRRRPVMLYNRVAKYFGARMGVLATKGERPAGR